MGRNIDRDDATAKGEEMVRDGSLIIEDRINRRDGLVEYEGTAEGGTTVDATVSELRTTAEPATRVTATEVPVEPAPAATVTETVTTETMPASQAMASGIGEGDDSLSMSTDNTAAGRMAETAAMGPITQVREGMSVVDAAGEDLGTVERVQMGDPSAVTTMGQDAGGGGAAAAPVGLAGSGGSGGSGAGAAGGGGVPLGAFGGGDLDLPEAFAADLQRTGFVKIDGKGLFARDRYAAADEIADVSGSTVRLSVGKDALRTS